VELSRYLQILQRRKWVVILTALVTVAVVLLGRGILPPIYTATTKLRVVPFSINAPDYGTYVYFDRLANTYSEIIKSSSVQDETKKRLKLDRLPPYRVETIPQTELMRLSVDADDPPLAINVCKTLAAILIEENRSLYNADQGVQLVLHDRLTQLETDLNKLIAERSVLLDATPRDNERIASLDRTIDAKQQTYSLTLTSYTQALVSQSTMASALTIIEDARLPDEPPTNVARDIVLSGAVGLLGGVGLAFVLEARTTRFYSDEQIRNVAQAPLVGKIPKARHMWRVKGGKGGAEGKNDTWLDEAFRRLRIMVFSNHKSTPARMVLVTSALPREGKTTVSAHLAASMASAGKRVILVDCDMRLPTLHERLKLSNEKGLSSVLEGKESLQKIIQHTAVPQFDVVTAGPPVPNPAELLGSTCWADLSATLMKDYDEIVLDGPPILAVPDALVLAPHVSGVLLVIDQWKSSQQAVTAAHEQLDKVGARLLGVLVNRAKTDASFHTYKSYPSYRQNSE